MSTLCVRARRGASLEERLRLHTVVAPSGCWVWIGARTKGYGRIQINGSTGYAHRVSYEVRVGTIPDGLQIDHVCRYTACINPTHLQAVTPKVNVERSHAPTVIAGRRPKCPHGYLRSEHGFVRSGKKVCRVCFDAYITAYNAIPFRDRQARRAAGLPIVDLAAIFTDDAEQVSA